MKNPMMFIAFAMAMLVGCVSGPKVDNAPVAALDLNRYLGEWYEIARFDHSFERGIEQAKANYTLNEDGTIKVVNSGIKNGKPKTAIGKGKLTDTPALLRVSFFGPFYADYRVMMIDDDYAYAFALNSSKVSGRLSFALGSRNPKSTSFCLRAWSPLYIARICGTDTWLSSMIVRKSSGK